MVVRGVSLYWSFTLEENIAVITQDRVIDEKAN